MCNPLLNEMKVQYYWQQEFTELWSRLSERFDLSTKLACMNNRTNEGIAWEELRNWFFSLGSHGFHQVNWTCYLVDRISNMSGFMSRFTICPNHIFCEIYLIGRLILLISRLNIRTSLLNLILFDLYLSYVFGWSNP